MDDYASKLAMIWLRGQDLNGKTPEQIADMYWDAYRRISDHLSESQNSGRISK